MRRRMPWFTMTSDKPIFFAAPAAWRAWLEKHHATKTELSVGFFKTGSRKPSITWPESVDGALCFGWIDGVRNGIDADRYRIRFTPRRVNSIWSAVNVNRVGELIRAGLMTPAGLAAFEARTEKRSAIYSYEDTGKTAALSRVDEAQFELQRVAWTYFQARPASYRRAAIWWVVSAKQEVTRARRLAKLIEDSAAERTVPQFTRRAAPIVSKAE